MQITGLDRPPPVRVVTAPLMIGQRSEVERRDVNHVPVEVQVRAVVAGADVPGHLGVPMQVAAHDLTLLIADLRGGIEIE